MEQIFRDKPNGAKYGIKVDYDVNTACLLVYVEDSNQRGLILVIAANKEYPCAYIDVERKGSGIVCVAAVNDKIVLTPSKGVTVDDINGCEHEMYDDSVTELKEWALGFCIVALGVALIALFLL